MSYEHVYGHAGHPENEECDRMAVAAIEKIRGKR
jgi:ribonuclease HI